MMGQESIPQYLGNVDPLGRLGLGLRWHSLGLENTKKCCGIRGQRLAGYLRK